ncbi:carbohydrate ABC transporter permease [Kribbella sp. NPDC000426]|uniref:carbohydrate ABC transporter permease n=1 Tax=Kribbella sp. NPDC000426 TaxID=3154255 RepID=UPI0033250E6C
MTVSDRQLISAADLRRPGFRVGWTAGRIVVLVAAILAGAGPLFWTVRSALSSTQELLRDPLAIWPSRTEWHNLSDAWSSLEIGRYLLNTLVLVGGSWLSQIVVATTAGYALSVLRPWLGRVIYVAILATLFVPGTVSMVALYLTVLHVPGLGIDLTGTPLAVWLPAGAHAFNVLLAKQFFDGIPRELFDAAQVDGAGPLTIFWRLVLPLSRPLIAVISLLSVMSAWKDFLWPLIVLPDPGTQPLAVALPRLADSADQALLLAGMFIAFVPPLLIFIIFQRHIVQGISFTGLKG